LSQTGSTEAEAVAQLRAAIADLQQHSRVIQVELPLPAALPPHPWQRFAGMWTDDPDWSAFVEAVAEDRQEQNAQGTPA